MDSEEKMLGTWQKSRMLGSLKSRSAAPGKRLEGPGDRYKSILAIYYRGEERFGSCDMLQLGLKYVGLKRMKHDQF